MNRSSGYAKPKGTRPEPQLNLAGKAVGGYPRITQTRPHNIVIEADLTFPSDWVNEIVRQNTRGRDNNPVVTLAGNIYNPNGKQWFAFEVYGQLLNERSHEGKLRAVFLSSEQPSRWNELEKTATEPLNASH